MRHLHIAAILILLVILSGCETKHIPVFNWPDSTEVKKADAELYEEISRIIDSPHTENAFWGVYIKRMKDDKPYFTRNYDKSFMPASNMKLYSTASAMYFMGKDFQFKTPVFYTGEIDESGALRGNLIIEGSGDPAISGRYRSGITTDEILEEWVKIIKDAGIKTIVGDIIADDDFFDDNSISGTWENGYLTYWYAAPSSAISINDNLWQGYLYPAENPGEIARFDPPETEYMTFENNVITTVSTARINVDYVRECEGNHVVINGWMPVGGERERVRGCVYNATHYAATLVKEALQKNGIPVMGEARDIDDFAEAEKKEMRSTGILVHIHLSPPMSEIIRIINKPSQNYYADMLLKNLGKRFGDEGSFNGGEKVVQRFLKEAGAGGVDKFQMVDGSGLGRKDLVQPRQTGQLLEFMAGRPDFPEFYDSLPIAGVDGTISRRMKGEPTEGNVHAKTGYISNARSLSGYIDDRNGERWIFSMMCNYWMGSVSNIDDMIDQVCTAIAKYPGDE